MMTPKQKVVCIILLRVDPLLEVGSVMIKESDVEPIKARHNERLNLS